MIHRKKASTTNADRFIKPTVKRAHEHNTSIKIQCILSVSAQSISAAIINSENVTTIIWKAGSSECVFEVRLREVTTMENDITRCTLGYRTRNIRWVAINHNLNRSITLATGTCRVKRDSFDVVPGESCRIDIATGSIRTVISTKNLVKSSRNTTVAASPSVCNVIITRVGRYCFLRAAVTFAPLVNIFFCTNASPTW